MKNLEQEIEEESAEIKRITHEYRLVINQLERNIKYYTHWAWSFVIAGLAIAVLGIVCYIYFGNNFYSLNLLGDFYGGSVASIWSLAGLFFIYIAFLGQKQQLLNQQLEIKHSQLELKYTRFELSGQKEEMQQQNETLKQQRFENTFFQLLSVLTSIVNSMDLRSRANKSQVMASGRDCFENIYTRMASVYKSEKSRKTFESMEAAIISYDLVYSNYKSDLSHYFRTLYHIIKFVHTSEIKDKKQYTNIVRAQLSSYELILLFYNCIHSNGRQKFKPLIEKYSLLKNIDVSQLLDDTHKSEYAETAFELYN